MKRLAIEHIAAQLKAARLAKEISQTALGERAGLPQSHISKAENGAVDLTTSNLIELARALDLEVMLVPRGLVPAVSSLIRSHGRASLQGRAVVRTTATGTLSDAAARPAYSLDEDDAS